MPASLAGLDRAAAPRAAAGRSCPPARRTSSRVRRHPRLARRFSATASTRSASLAISRAVSSTCSRSPGSNARSRSPPEQPAAAVEDDLRRALRVGDDSVGRAVQRRHPLGLGGERDLGHPREARRRARACAGRPWPPPRSGPAPSGLPWRTSPRSRPARPVSCRLSLASEASAAPCRSVSAGWGGETGRAGLERTRPWARSRRP